MKRIYLISLLLVLSMLVLSSCQKTSEPTLPENYLQNWYGTYKGTSHQWRKVYTNSTWVEYHSYKDLVIDVQKGDLDSTLNFYFTYNDTVSELKRI